MYVSTEQDEDVTTLLLPYAGPDYTWHNCDMTPTKLGHNSLTFQLYNGEEYTFTESQVINLPT